MNASSSPGSFDVGGLGQSGRPLLLLVDDQPANLSLLYSAFEVDCDVSIALNGAAALEFCRNRQPDLILLDVVMPELGGFAVCQQLKQDPATRDIPVIFVTGQDSAQDELRGLEVGGVDFITKPFNLNIVRARVRTQLLVKYQSDRLRELALVDGLTGIGNRRHFDDRIEAEWRQCARDGKPLSLMMVDVDFFKRYNDHYGHQAGDACLVEIGQLLRAHCARPHDLAARYGGEEFVCLFPAAGLDGALAKARAIEAELSRRAIEHSGSTVSPHVTVSIGVASAMPANGDHPSDLLRLADELLYRAKNEGRARICAACLPHADVSENG
jgi:diguanylate cyclase (GGDEF)-like protein